MSSKENEFIEKLGNYQRKNENLMIENEKLKNENK